MTRTLCLSAGLFILAALWLGPLPLLAPFSFSAHMALHMGVVAVAAPLLAAGLAGGAADPTRRWPALFHPVPAAVAELIVVWGWHAPAWHHAARHTPAGLIAEQTTFLAAGLWLWMSAVGGAPHERRRRAWTGVAGLLFTSIHMTLLGAIFAMAARPLYLTADVSDAAALADQHLGGGLMLIVGGVSYLAGGLWLVVDGLRRAAPPARSPA